MYRLAIGANPLPAKGFNLIELMIVVAIVAILAAVAYPSYTEHVIKSRRSDAQSALMSFAQAMERHKTENNTYTSAITGTAPRAPDIFPTQAPIDGSNKFYNLTVQAVTGTSYTLRATPIVGTAQAGDGIIELTSTSIRRWDRDNDLDLTEASDLCWEKTC